MKKTPLKMVISIEGDEPTNVDPITGSDEKATEIDGEKPVGKPGEDTTGETPKPLPKGENSIETALQAPKGEDNEDAKGVPSVDKLAKDGAKGGVPEQPRQVVPSVESRRVAALTLRQQANQMLVMAASMEDDTPVAISDNPQAEDGFKTTNGGKPEDATPIAAEGTTPTGKVQEIELNDAMSVEPDVTSDLDVVIDEAEADFDQEQEEAAAVERLELTEATVQKLVDNGTGTEETLQLIDDAVTPALESLGIRLIMPSMESYGKLTVQQKHRVALESIKSAIATMKQSNDVGRMDLFDSIGDFFRTKSSIIQKYRKLLEEIKSNASNGQYEPKGEHLDLTRLYEFFSLGGKQVEANISAVTKKDTDASRAILEGYTSAVVNGLAKLDAIVKKVPGKVEDAAAIFKQIETIPNPIQAFPKQVLSEKHLLGGTELVMTSGSARKPEQVAGVALSKLAELATAHAVKETRNLKHGFKVGMKKGTIWDGILSNKVKIQPQEVSQMAECGLAYLNAVEKYRAAIEKLDNLDESVGEGINNLQQAVSKFGDKSAARAAEQVKQIHKNLVNQSAAPGAKEMKRALEGAKYCYYAAFAMHKYSH